MNQLETSALDAVWHSPHNADEKLILAHLTSKHELGQRSSTSWKELDAFLHDFEDRWSDIRDLAQATRLSQVKLTQALEKLENAGYIKSEHKPTKLGKRRKIEAGQPVPKEKFFAVTRKVFEDFQGQQHRGSPNYGRTA